MREGIRILQVSTADNGGGAEGTALFMHQTCRARNLDSWLAVGRKTTNDPTVVMIPNAACRPLWARFWNRIERRIAVTRYSRYAGYAGRVGLLAEPKRLWERLLGTEDLCFPGTWGLLNLPAGKPSIVHCHNLHGGYFDLRALPWLSSQVPVIISLHDAWLLGGHCAHSFDCDKWRNGCGKCPSLSTYPAIWRDSTGANWRRKADIFRNSRLYVCTPSEWLMCKVHQSSLRAAAYKVIPNGVDLSVFHPASRPMARKALGLPLDKKVALYVANGIRNNPWKDYVTLEAACRWLSAKFRGRFLCVCLGARNEEPTLPCMRFVPFVTDPLQIAKYHQAADVYVHAAKQEVFGKVITESLACGNPVVATDVGGISEQIREGETGFLVPPGDAIGLAEATCLLLRDDALRTRMGEAASRDADARFGLDRQADSFLAWYEEVIQDWTDWRAHAPFNPE